jgi:hypothetical protein
MLAVLGALAAASCTERRAPAPPAQVPVTGQATTKPGDAPPSRRPRNPEATVYVDGSPVAIMRAMELPPSLKEHTFQRTSGPTTRFLVSEYLEAIKVDLSKVKAVHFHGGSRVVTVSGDEVRKHKANLGFNFTLGDRGKVNMYFPGGMAIDTTIDLLSNMAVYVEKEPPVLHREKGDEYLALADGKPLQGMAYAEQDQLKGTRVYVDGVLVSTLKRRLLKNDLLAGEVGRTNAFRFAAYLESVGAKADKVKAIDLLCDDDLVARLDSGAWTKAKEEMTFTLPARSKGQLVIPIPSNQTLRARISAVQLYVKSEPPKRWLAPSDAVALADEGSGELAQRQTER